MFVRPCTIKKNSTGVALNEQLQLVFQKFNLDYDRLISITSDGAENSLGKNIGLISLTKKFIAENSIENQITNFHYLLHQEN